MYESRMYGNVMRNSIVCLIGIEKLFESIVHETLSKHICTYDTYSHYELIHYTMEQRNGEREKKNTPSFRICSHWDQQFVEVIALKLIEKRKTRKKIVSMCLRNQNGIELENRCHMNEALRLPYQCVFFFFSLLWFWIAFFLLHFFLDCVWELIVRKHACGAVNLIDEARNAIWTEIGFFWIWPLILNIV